MRNLSKGNQPDILRDNEADWLTEIEDAEARGESPTKTQLSRYNHADIKSALLAETRDKCAYCESKLRHIAYGDIEHVLPKDIAPKLRFNWQNLTIACDVCNTKKGTKVGIIDPYTDDPQASFFFIGPTIFAREGYDKAQFTEATLSLNRIQLVERRIRVIERIVALIRSAKMIRDPEMKRALIDDIKTNECDIDVEFSVMAGTYLKALIAEGEI